MIAGDIKFSVHPHQLYRSTAMHYLPSLFTWFFQTFRGRFTALLEFFTNFVTREQAQEYIDETMRVMTAAIEAARLPPATELMLTPESTPSASSSTNNVASNDKAAAAAATNGSAATVVENGGLANGRTVGS
jgi:hypothetical protein